jgi:hypothetical protein
MRLDELAKLTAAGVDLDQNLASVMGKGRRPRSCPFGHKTAQALGRYLRRRKRQRQAELPELWLGVNGRPAMTDNGISQMVRKRGAAAGIPELHPQIFRHTFAHECRLAGGASAADARAREVHRASCSATASDRAAGQTVPHGTGDREPGLCAVRGSGRERVSRLGQLADQMASRRVETVEALGRRAVAEMARTTARVALPAVPPGLVRVLNP